MLGSDINCGKNYCQKHQENFEQTPLNNGESATRQSRIQSKTNFSLFQVQSVSQFIKENISYKNLENYQNLDRFILKFNNLESQENTFFKSLVIIHFKHLLFNDHIDIHNLSLFDLFERVKNRKIVLKPSPLYHTNISSDQLNESFCTNIYTLIKLKTQVGKTQLYKNFLEMIVNEKIFFESLLLIMKQLAIENVQSDNFENNEEFNGIIQHINHSWIEMKPEFITLLSRTLNKQIEVVYLLENRAESMVYERIKTRYNAENTRIRLIYWHSNLQKKSYYFPLIDENEINIFIREDISNKTEQICLSSEDQPEQQTINISKKHSTLPTENPYLSDNYCQSHTYTDLQIDFEFQYNNFKINNLQENAVNKPEKQSNYGNKQTLEEKYQQVKHEINYQSSQKKQSTCQQLDSIRKVQTNAPENIIYKSPIADQNLIQSSPQVEEGGIYSLPIKNNEIQTFQQEDINGFSTGKPQINIITDNQEQKPAQSNRAYQQTNELKNQFLDIQVDDKNIIQSIGDNNSEREDSIIEETIVFGTDLEKYQIADQKWNKQKISKQMQELMTICSQNSQKINELQQQQGKSNQQSNQNTYNQRKSWKENQVPQQISPNLPVKQNSQPNQQNFPKPPSQPTHMYQQSTHNLFQSPMYKAPPHVPPQMPSFQPQPFSTQMPQKQLFMSNLPGQIKQQQSFYKNPFPPQPPTQNSAKICIQKQQQQWKQ